MFGGRRWPGRIPFGGLIGLDCLKMLITHAIGLITTQPRRPPERNDAKVMRK
jgi:hypothetical protein